MERNVALSTRSAPVIHTRIERKHGRAVACVATIEHSGAKDRARVSYEGLGLSHAHEQAAQAMARRMAQDGTRWVGAHIGADADKCVFVPLCDID
jgi:hypothetical protein